MAGKLIAIANMKGGVGKTTTVVSLAEALAADDPSASILVVDLDPQASASVCLAGENLLAEMITDDHTVEAFLEDRLLNHETTKLAPKIRNAVVARRMPETNSRFRFCRAGHTCEWLNARLSIISLISIST